MGTRFYSTELEEKAKDMKRNGHTWKQIISETGLTRAAIQRLFAGTDLVKPHKLVTKEGERMIKTGVVSRKGNVTTHIGF